MTDKQLIRFVDRRLQQGAKWQQIADELDEKLPTLYSKVRNLGYTTGKRLVPTVHHTRKVAA